MKTVFQFRDGCHLSGDAQAVGERLERIKDKAASLTPALVLKDARNIRSPLHTFFEWDDTVAAERYRLEQAGHLVRSVVVSFEATEPQPVRQVLIESVEPAPAPAPRMVRAFLPIKSEAGERSYVSTQQAMGDPVMRRQVLERAHSEMTAVGRKYAELSEMAEVFGALNRVGELLGTERQPA